MFGETDLRRLAATAARYDADLQAKRFSGEEGHALRGFYVHDYTVLKRPLIVVNTAGHRVGVACTFWHEMGHHLTHTIFGSAHERVEMFFSTNYQDHLRHPHEIAADLVTVLAGYPRTSAETLFGDSRKSPAMQNAGAYVSRVLPYVRSISGFDFGCHFTPTEMLRCLAGMIHVAKLREALLHEYGI
ncbi:MAG: hypothetical protein ACREQR_02485 [Candidatus Binataceae bacterium]